MMQMVALWSRRNRFLLMSSRASRNASLHPYPPIHHFPSPFPLSFPSSLYIPRMLRFLCPSTQNQVNKMYTGKSMDFNHYCGDMSESIDYLEQEMGGESPIYHLNHPLSFRSIPKHIPAYASEGDLFQVMSIEEDLMAHQLKEDVRYKCYRCFGTNRDISVLNGQATVCPECEGTEYISGSNPLANIFQRVLTLKIPHLAQRPEPPPLRPQPRKSRDFLLNYNSQKSIQQQDTSFSYVDQTMQQCNCCLKQVQVYHMFSCTSCNDYHVCFNCFQYKKYTHPLTHELVNRGLNKIEVRYIDNPKTMKKISQEVQSEQTSNYLDSSQSLDIKCHSCNQSIEQCYMACLNCQLEGYQYIICAECSKQGSYLHDLDHKLDLKTLAQASKLLKLSSKPSASESEITQPTPSKSKVKVKESLVIFDQFDMEDGDADFANGGITFPQENLISKFAFNASPTNEDVRECSISRNIKPDLFCKMTIEEDNKLAVSQGIIPEDEGEDFTHLLVKKKVKKIEDSVVNIDMDTSIQLPIQEKSQEFTPTFTPYAFSTINNQIVTQKSIQANPEEYVFNDYQCDICKASPIKNKRYHCKQCENYDLCQMCFIVRSKRHQHKDYECVDGLEIIKKNRENILKLQQSKTKLSMSRVSQSRLSQSRARLTEFSNKI